MFLLHIVQGVALEKQEERATNHPPPFGVVLRQFLFLFFP
jgi:hypothetical protein